MPEAFLELTDEIRQTFRRWRQPLDTEQGEQFAVYLELLERWNQEINLTAIRDRQTAILRHFVEPAMALQLLTGAGPVLLDAGSGLGVPGLPFKILAPERRCVLVEANQKKATFLKEVVDELGLEDVEVLDGRFEEFIVSGDLGPPVHVLTARAWSAWGELLGVGAGLMAPGGRAILFVGEETLRALRRHLSAAQGGGTARDPEWQPAARAGWSIRRVLPLPHMDTASVVSLELPREG